MAKSCQLILLLNFVKAIFNCEFLKGREFLKGEIRDILLTYMKTQVIIDAYHKLICDYL